MDKERANAGWVCGRVKQWIWSSLGLISAEERTPFAPATTGNDLAVVLNDEVGLVINQLGVDAEYVASDRVCLFRRIVADTQGVTGEFNELAKSWDIRSLSSTQFHC